MEKMIGRLKQIEEDLDRLKSLEASGHIIEGTSRKVNRKSETVHVFLLQLLSLPGADLRLAFGGLISGSVLLGRTCADEDDSGSTSTDSSICDSC